MNIYCIIFMCTFGSNSTDTETAGNNNTLIQSGAGALKNETDIASMILPEKGMPVPQMPDIVMDLPNMPDSDSSSNSNRRSGTESGVKPPSSTATPSRAGPSPSLSDILLPPSPLRNQVLSDS